MPQERNIPPAPNLLPTLWRPWRLWVWWVLGSLSGAVLGAILGFALAYLIFGGEAPGVPLLVAGAIAGGWFGAAQWAILRDYLPTLNGLAWVAVTAVAGAVVWTVAGDAGRTAFLTLLVQGLLPPGPESQPLLLTMGTALGG